MSTQPVTRARPRPSQRCTDGIARLAHNTDFAELQAHIAALYEDTKDRLVTTGTEQSFLQLQGRAQQLKDILDLITKKD